MKAPSLDELVLLPETLAIQRHYDARNYRTFRWLLGLALVLFLVAIGHSLQQDWYVSLAFDDKGNVLLSFLWIQKNGLPSYWGHGPGANGIFVRRSADGGKTWDKDAAAVIEWKGDEADVKLEDMPRIWADTQPKSPHRGNLYNAWIEWQIEQSIVLFSRSTDAGKTWSKPMRTATSRTRASSSPCRTRPSR